MRLPAPTPAAAHLAERAAALLSHALAVVRAVGLLGGGVLHRLVDRQDEARRLARGEQRVALHHRRLPHEALEGVAHAVLDDVDAEPLVPLRVLHPQLVEHIGRVDPRVGRHLPRDHLERLGEGGDHQLRLAEDGARVVAQVGGELHLDRAAAGDDARVLDQPPRVHDRVVQRALRLGDELLGAAAQHDGARLRLGAAREEVEALAADLPLLEVRAAAEDRRREVIARRLDRRARRAGGALHVVVRHAAGAEEAAVGEVLRRQVADREAGEDDLRARRDDLGQLVVDDVPLGVHHLLVRRDVRDSHLCVVALRLQLQLHVEQDDLWVLELLLHLLEAGVRESLLECHALDHYRVLQRAALHLLHPDERDILVVVKREDCVYDHLREELLVS
mmetsp:Transcript_21095/g.48316  ORF Transcript_21095/g.48316 Transcript_21095/m.48316 type:complete len:391 (-) Transcript_21095:564-1736(-)